MKLVASLLASVTLFASSMGAYATPLSPLDNGFSITVGNTLLDSSNLSYNAARGTFSFSDGLSSYTFIGVAADPLLDGLSITRTCINLNVFSPGCSSQKVSISNANVLDGLLQLNAGLGVKVSAGAQAGVSNLLFASTTVGVAAESALVGYPTAPSSAQSPVPEPGTLGLMATGLLGVAGAIRRRLNV